MSPNHIKTLIKYLETIERNLERVQSKEDWQMWSVDTLDNVKAALILVRCMDA